MAIGMDYEAMERMKAEFAKSSEELDKVRDEAMKIAMILEDGGLRGAAGEAFVDAIRSSLYRKITELLEKFEELAKDIQDNIDIMRKVDEDAGKYVGR
jgi:WXG100 family type VII secretion target